mmetsp:Transcript_5615/g.11436  ORF Transcript_5615/g.11436 Transcript_5615/m.11436 type:complete len:243 (+) Transcript_5615:99-827(+)
MALTNIWNLSFFMSSGLWKPSSSSESASADGRSEAARPPLAPPGALSPLPRLRRARHTRINWSPTAHAATSSQYAKLSIGDCQLPLSAAHGDAASNARGAKAPRDGTNPARAVVSKRAESAGTRTRRKDWIPAMPGVHTKTATKTNEVTDKISTCISGTALQRPHCHRRAPKLTPRGTVTTIAVKAGLQKANSTPTSASSTALKPGGGHGSSSARMARERPQQAVVRASAMAPRDFVGSANL